MAGYNTVTCFFDESGKFKDHQIICFGGVAAFNENFNPFGDEWGRLLYRNGLQLLTAKTAFNAERPLSSKNDRTGTAQRINDLAPFIACIRKHLQVVIGVTIDVRAFKRMSPHFFRTYGHDPVFVAFARSLLEVVSFTPDRDKISFICDDDEQTGLPLFRLYRKIKIVWPDARKKLAGITFADDRVLFGLQAADLVAGLMRLEAGRKWLRTKYHYAPLFKSLSRQPSKNEKLWNVAVAFGDKTMLANLSASLEAARKTSNTST